MPGDRGTAQDWSVRHPTLLVDTHHIFVLAWLCVGSVRGRSTEQAGRDKPEARLDWRGHFAPSHPLSWACAAQGVVGGDMRRPVELLGGGLPPEVIAEHKIAQRRPNHSRHFRP